MKRILLFVLLSGVALAAAAQDPASSSVEVRGSQIALPANAYPVLAADFDRLRGAYQLSTGQTMVLRREGRRLYADVGSLPAKELVATDHNQFVALDRQLKMTIEEHLGGYMTGELLMVMPRSLGSTASGGQVRLISFR